MEYKLRVCVEMLNYAFHETDLRASETKKALAVFFDEETIEQASAILRGEQRPTSGAVDGGEGSDLQAESTPEANPAPDVSSQPAHHH